jgi:DeoR/GlpR family transcriptional regulator of sugar metabolism
VTGLDTINFLNRFHANRTVISASGLTVEGPTEVHSGAAAVQRVMLKRAAERILLLDHSKYDQPHLEIVCPLAEINRLITDAPAPPLLGSALRIAGVDVMH